MRVASRCSASKGTSTSKRSDRYQCALASNVERIEQSRLKQEQAGQARCCACRERPRRRAAEQRDEIAPPDHTITSSARARSEGGTSKRSALAVLRLITSSNLLACTTGRSAGLAPLRTRAV